MCARLSLCLFVCLCTRYFTQKVSAIVLKSISYTLVIAGRVLKRTQENLFFGSCNSAGNAVSKAAWSYFVTELSSYAHCKLYTLQRAGQNRVY